jgi:hypothetical protein
MKQFLKESKVFDVFADDLLAINIAAAQKGESTAIKQKIKQVFKDLHSQSPDLNKIHAEIKALKDEFNITETDEVETEHDEFVASAAASKSSSHFSQEESDIYDDILDLNIKISTSKLPQDQRADIRSKLKALRSKIGSVANAELKKEIDSIDSQI